MIEKTLKENGEVLFSFNNRYIYIQERFSGGGELGYVSIEELEDMIDTYGGNIVNYDKPRKLSELKMSLSKALF